MMDQPSALEIVTVVREFLEQKVMPELKGHSAFHARVAANALGIVARELEIGPKANAEELARLKAILGIDGSLMELNREFSTRIRSGRISIETPAVAEHLRLTTLDKIKIDQPGYSGLRTALGLVGKA
jgi:hypothetical protein